MVRRSCFGLLAVGVVFLGCLAFGIVGLFFVGGGLCGWPEWPDAGATWPPSGVQEGWGLCGFHTAALAMVGPARFSELFAWLEGPYWRRAPCFPGLGFPETVADVFRPPTDCQFCAGIASVERRAGMTKLDFEQNFSDGARPVVIAGAMDSWQALDIFSFEFFEALYTEVVGRENIETSLATCNFFQYNSAFESLSALFNMSNTMDGNHNAARDPGSPGWYVGWSNCRDRVVKKVFRKLYSRPEFLPDAMDDSDTDWIFIGTPGPGAELHHDQIMEPSWQAQVAGVKRWDFVPPVECRSVCRELSTVVHRGEIIVLDTHRWFHKTTVLGDGLSITIGSEFSGTDADTWDNDSETVQARTNGEPEVVPVASPS